MSGEIKEVAQAIATHPKTSAAIVATTQVEAWIVQWFNPVLDALASLAAFILAVVLIRYNLHKTDQVIEEKKSKRND